MRKKLILTRCLHLQIKLIHVYCYTIKCILASGQLLQCTNFLKKLNNGNTSIMCSNNTRKQHYSIWIVLFLYVRFLSKTKARFLTCFYLYIVALKGLRNYRIINNEKILSHCWLNYIIAQTKKAYLIKYAFFAFTR